jgi:quinol monooxygenase YgiN
MIFRQFLLVGASMVTLSIGSIAHSQDVPLPYVRIATLEIDPATLDAFKAATKVVGQTSIRDEPGCLALYAVSDKDNPAHVTVFEIYREASDYAVHIQSLHFKTFRTTTEKMVLSRKLTEVTPFSLAAKSH